MTLSSRDWAGIASCDSNAFDVLSQEWRAIYNSAPFLLTVGFILKR
jgi:hypothetical protein